MSITKGTAVFLDVIDIIKDAGNGMHAQTLKNEEKYKAVVDLEQTALRLGLCRISKYTFKWVCVKSFKGDTGPTPPYALRLSYTRICSIAFLLATYPDVMKIAMKNQKPSSIVTLAFRLAHAISSAWDAVDVMGEEDE
ncbi:hypothetical protein CVT25_007980 [Psilocybe cyanescens]|uniref:DALR anticodon binding domain-containing protein n=1 Tax=Psilocybe cyanescens TaxID=93625 RepID=A0A409XTI2_PSICY|nr:hypothetical protein CVT25_007980 [Psilocybe cyanescens]